VRLLLADDHSLVLAGIRQLLESRHEILGSAEDGRALVRAAEAHKPDLIVLDISMPFLNGIAAATEIRARLPKTKFVFLTMHASPIYLRKAICAGALGYVLKSEAAEELLNAIEEVQTGRLYVSPGFGESVIANARDWLNKPLQKSTPLTERQRQILQMVAEGRQNKEIAEISHISVKTVEFHRGRLMSKLGAHSVAELTKFAIQEGLLTLPDAEEDL
jgi:DNA-binding NarL/FixJ family response regulator